MTTPVTTAQHTHTQWLGPIPAAWDVIRLKFVATVFPSNVDKHSREDETPVELCNYTDVYYNDIISADIDFMKATATSEQIEKFQLRSGDTIITKDSESADDIGISAYVPEDLDGVVCGYHLSIIRPGRRVSGRFIKRLFDSHYVKAILETSANGLTRVGLGQYALDNIDIPVPPLTSQNAIAAFLDHETAKIDALIDKQEQLIATLREERQSVVSSALSGYPTIPLHRLVDPARPMSYGILQCGEHVEDGIPYIGPSDMPGRGDSPALDRLRRTSPEIADQYRRSVVQGGDIVVSIGPAYGKVALLTDDLSGSNLTQDTVRVAPVQPSIDPDFLVWALGSYEAESFWDAEITGATFRRLNLGTLGQTPIPLPDLTTQQDIRNRLEATTANVDTLIDKSAEMIKVLREYRSALITNAVTGKIDVREAV